ARIAPPAERGEDVFARGMDWHNPEQVVKPLPGTGRGRADRRGVWRTSVVGRSGRKVRTVHLPLVACPPPGDMRLRSGIVKRCSDAANAGSSGEVHQQEDSDVRGDQAA